MAGNETEIYVSTDIEADGPIPGPHSMLSIGSAAYTADKTVIATFSANLQTLPGAAGDERTMKWWAHFPEAWEACRRNARLPEEVMVEYAAWLESLHGRLVFVGWPATWDFMWVYWYLLRFTGKRPFHEHGIDIRSYAMGMRRTEFRRTSRTYLPRRWFDEDLPHTHVALDDALEQGAMFCNMLAENKRRDGG